MRGAPYPIRVLVADDHDIIRAGLRGLLSPEADIEVVTEASTGQQAVALSRQLKPDVVLIDVRMPGLDGLAAARAIVHESPSTRVIVCTAFQSAEYLRGAVASGASGYVLKTATRAELLAAIRRVAAGEQTFDGELASDLLRQLVGQPRNGVVALTPREREVLRLLARGLTNRRIGEELSVSQRTAKAYVESIINKLGVENRTQAAARAIEEGLVPPSPGDGGGLA
jgi:DNA-binding NarL/FixJ family response regulator